MYSFHDCVATQCNVVQHRPPSPRAAVGANAINWTTWRLTRWSSLPTAEQSRRYSVGTWNINSKTKRETLCEDTQSNGYTDGPMLYHHTYNRCHHGYRLWCTDTLFSSSLLKIGHPKRYFSLNMNVSEGRMLMFHVPPVREHRARGHYLTGSPDRSTVKHDICGRCAASLDRYAVRLKRSPSSIGRNEFQRWGNINQGEKEDDKKEEDPTDVQQLSKISMFKVARRKWESWSSVHT